MQTFKLGKKPARPWRAPGSAFRFATYLAPALPTPPPQFGHENLVADWGMLANDRYGDCVWAGAAHETMMLTREGGHPAAFTDADVLSDYAAVTGFSPAEPASDRGTDMQAAAAYRRKTGIIDSTGRRHTVAAYLALDPGNVDHLIKGAYLFGAVGVGLELPASAIDQARKGQMWDVVPGAPIEGGHYVPLVGRLQNLVVVTWGEIQLMSERFLAAYCDEAVAYVSTECLVNRKSPEGFDYASLIADLKELNA